MNSDLYDIEAKVEPSVADALQKLPPDQREEADDHLALAFLKDRCQFSAHRDVRQLPVFELVIAKGGPKLKEASPDELIPQPASASGAQGGRGWHGTGVGYRRGSLDGQAATMAVFVGVLSMYVGRPVIDKTGLAGHYDFTLQFTPDEMASAVSGASPEGGDGQPPLTPGAYGASIFSALQEQLGLRLDSTKGPVEVIVIDHVEKPSGN
jgi:uncharacterized protein (TIGR03435 family)